MKQVHATDIAHAAPIDGRGRRSPQTQLLINERDKLLVEAAKFFPHCSQREQAKRIATSLLRYRCGAWRRHCVESTLPVRCRGLDAICWTVLKTRDRLCSEATIRRALSSHALFVSQYT
jgi:hypothetical protein